MRIQGWVLALLLALAASAQATDFAADLGARCPTLTQLEWAGPLIVEIHVNTDEIASNRPHETSVLWGFLRSSYVEIEALPPAYRTETFVFRRGPQVFRVSTNQPPDHFNQSQKLHWFASITWQLSFLDGLQGFRVLCPASSR